MDDFANMLLAKHESNRQQQQAPTPTVHHIHQTTEVRTNLFTKASYMVTVNDEDQSLPDVVS